MKFLFVILLITAASCGSAEDNSLDADDNVVKTDTVATIPAVPVTNENNIDTGRTKTNDSTLFIKFREDSLLAVVGGTLHGINHPVTVYIDIKQGHDLTVSLHTKDSLANIRINQLFTPDGKADGPFGKDLKRSIHQRGTYKLVISENMMQGDEWKGDFTLSVVVI